ncbi:MAG: SURF1 family protein [Ornithinibacter sp.]
MLRTALKPRFLGLFGLCVVIAIAFGQLGRWQLGVAEDSASREALESARALTPAELSSVLQPHAAFPGELSTRPVTATGSYAGAGQVLVPDRFLDGVRGLWVITPFVVDSTRATLPVLRGFVQDPGGAGAPPTGTLTITGALAPGESPSDAPLPQGQIGSVDLSLLVNSWPGDLYNAFVFLSAEVPSTGTQLTKVPTPVAPTGLKWRNAAYALQWWIFAAFAFWMWWRMVRDSAREEREHLEGRPSEGADDAVPLPTGDNGAREHA